MFLLNYMDYNYVALHSYKYTVVHNCMHTNYHALNHYLFNIRTLWFQTTDQLSRISADPSIETVGDPQDVMCILLTTSVLDPSSVISFWTGPNGIVTDDNRITINTTGDSSSYNTTLHFSYLSESDEGIYTCNVTTDNHSVSRSTNLTNFISKLPLGNHKIIHVLHLPDG